MANDQINVPSLLVVIVLSGLIVRYLFFSSATPAAGGHQQQAPRDSLAQWRQREAAVERIQQMFPQVDRRTVLWDLQRTGGNIAATTERILSGRVERPPITFQPPPPPGSTTANSQSTASGAKLAEKPAQPDLIQRYNLQDKIKSSGETPAAAEDSSSLVPDGSNKKGWSSSKDERQSALQRRRDEMILAARRKMEAKIAAEKAASEAGS